MEIIDLMTIDYPRFMRDNHSLQITLPDDESLDVGVGTMVVSIIPQWPIRSYTT